MVNHVRPGTSRPAARITAALAAWRADESGSIRTDRYVMGLGVVAVLGLLIITDLRSEEPTPGEAAAGQGVATPRRMISAVGPVAPQPLPLPEGSQRQSHASASYEERFNSQPDTEAAILRMLTEEAIAAEAAAGGPPPVAEAIPTAEAVPTAEAAAEAMPVAEGTVADGS
jgi:hypothetical protein